MDRAIRKLAGLTADAIDVGVAVVTLPAKWAVKGLRFLAADRQDDASGEAPAVREAGGQADR